MFPKSGHVEVVKELLQNGANVNASTARNWSSLQYAVVSRRIRCTLQLICFGAEINERAIGSDKTRLLQPIVSRWDSLQAGKGMETTLMSHEERHFMWNLAFFFTIKHRVAAFKAYYAIRSFITFNGIFMGPGYDHGKGSVWNNSV